MIYTVTFNPAIDYIAEVKGLEMNEINRATSEKILAGGKGINVSVVLKNLGIDSIALGFIAGFTGQEIKRKLLSDVMIERKTHEKLKEKAFEDFQKELKATEAKEIDELVSYRFNKKDMTGE